MYCVFVFIPVKGITFHFYCTIPELESERKIILDFGLHLLLDLINLSIYVILYYHSINLFNYFLHICHLLSLSFRRRQSETFLLLKYFYSRELDNISFQANVLLI